MSDEKWKPVNYHGTIAYDPRDEVKARAKSVEPEDVYVAIPVALAYALADLHECDSTATLTCDEDGPMPPMTVRCKKIREHLYNHSNGYAEWKP